MAWVKIPRENHPLFRDCLPRDPWISTVNMFGGVAAKVNGQMFAGLFARGAVAQLSAPDQRAALAIDGAGMFDPMGNGRIMRDTVFLPESVLEERDELRGWLRKAFEYTATLPAKKARPRALTSNASTTDGRTVRAFNPLSRNERMLFEVLLAGEHALHGFTNRDMRRKLRRTSFPLASDEDRQPAQVTRLFRRLHAHGLIAKIPRSHRWRVSLAGRRTMSTAIKLREVAYPALFAAAA